MKSKKMTIHLNRFFGFFGLALALIVQTALVPGLLAAGPRASQEEQEQGSDILDKVMTEEQKQEFYDYVNAAKKTAAETKEKLESFLKGWNWILDHFASFSPEAREAINKLNNAGAKSKVESASNFLGEFNSQIDEAMESKGKLDKVLTIIDRYKPEKDNPFRSLEVLKNLLDDLESLLPDPDKTKDPVSKVTIKLIKIAIDYFRTAITGAYDGLKNIQKTIRQRAAGCIGYVGGDATLDKSDPKRKAFVDLNTGELICYSGIRPVGGEVWNNMDGNAVFVWSDGQWTKLLAGMGEARDVFALSMKAYGKAISSSEFIRWCTDAIGVFRSAKSRAANTYATLFEKLTSCQRDILKFADVESELANLLSSCHNDRDEFTGKYVFAVGDVRGTSEVLAKFVENSVLITGSVIDENERPVSKATVTVTAGSAKGKGVSDENGLFKLLLDLKLSETGSQAATISVSDETHPPFKDETRISEPCTEFGKLKLQGDETLDLTISPAQAKIKVGETVTFVVTAKGARGGLKDVTGAALEANTFTGTEPGEFSVTASYGGKSVKAAITVESEEKEKTPDDAIDDMSGDNEEDICSLAHIKSLTAEVNELVAKARELNAEFSNYAHKFEKEINGQTSQPCSNGLLAYCYANAVELAGRLEALVSEIQDKSTEIIMLQGICPDLAKQMRADGMTLGGLVRSIAGVGSYSGLLDRMNARLNENGCDENEVIQLGQRVVPPEQDPNFVQSGGNMTEISGDGVDNNGNGLQDEVIGALSGFNITFALYDSGSAKDDSFGLAISGYGSLGATPPGGLRNYGLNLPPATYTATVTVIRAPDNVGTYTLVVLENGKVIASSSGSPPQGGVASVTFTVTGNK